MMRNFILQQGFADPAPEIRQSQYAALAFQPRIVLIAVIAGIVFQSPAVFAALSALLWSSALVPKLNTFSAIYNLTIGRRPGAFRLGPAPAPRRGAETMAGAFALAIALLLLSGFNFTAYVLEAIFLAASLGVEFGGFCFGTFAFHLRRGNVKFALETLPWAKNEMKTQAKGDKTIMNNQVTPPSIGGNSAKAASAPGRAKRVFVFVYGTVTYAITLGIFVYAAGFIGNFAVPKAMDSGREVPLAQALVIDALLLGVFAIQHSVMARGWFKRWITRAIPLAGERSTYVLASNILMILLFWQWQPIGGTVWNTQDLSLRAAVYGIYAAGWVLLLLVTFLINHFDLFGLRQVWYYLRGREMPSVKFVTPGPYKFIRHPLYVGWFTIFWAAPTMTVAHLLFAVLTTSYILVAIQFEERDLVRHHGRAYADYRKHVPKFIPRLGARETVVRKAAPDSSQA
jgi:methanethiol S-methyltransferase